MKNFFLAIALVAAVIGTGVAATTREDGMKRIAFVLLMLAAVLGTGVAITTITTTPAAACNHGCE